MATTGRYEHSLGSSGVGKTTLLNAVTGGNRHTSPIREDDARGRHATTARELVALSNGDLMIDRPGLRATHIWEQAQGLEAAFADVDELAQQCRFADSLPVCVLSVRSGRRRPSPRIRG